MSSNFQKAIDVIRKKAINETEKGTAFEKLSKIYFENDDVQKQFYKKVWHYKDWARENPNFSSTDIGIDLVGELKNNSGFAAIQCKFFKSENQITKEDLDSFVSASSNDIFTRLILIDTSNQDLGSNAKSMLNNLNKTYQRIQKFDLERSRIDWLEYLENEKVILSKKKPPLDHQIQAIEEAKKYYSSNNRGKMIMACGTGKTYTSLKIAEAIANKKFVLYMVPSLALMSQSIREWKNDCEEEFIAFSACSDKKVGKVKNDNDQIQINLNELAIPATTDSKKLSEEIAKIEKNKMIVIFSTYQSIDVISDAQKKYNMDSFDLIICDEAHRTTGATFEGEEDSNFVKIHENKYVEGKNRLYMTATPRIFGNKAKRKADEGRVELASMDDSEKYGKEFFNRGFNWAVENNLLSDYKVVILAIDESLVSMNLQKSLEIGSELKLTDATKIIGVYKALAKVGFDKKENEKLKPIKKAIAFSQSIDISKIFEKEFGRVVKEYVKNENVKNENKVNLNVEVQHIDGSFNADQRNNHLNWLKGDTQHNTCRILSNVKCLSEGVDVPSLDAIVFLHPKKSQIDVVQAVGRVMRKAEGKDLGYVIIPVTVAPGVSPEKALNDNENYKVVWQIVNALRTHDERLDSKINLLGLGEDVSDKIEIVTMSAEQDATTAKVEDVAKKKSRKKKDDDDFVIDIDDDAKKDDDKSSAEKQMSFELDDLSQAIKAKIVKKCGTRDYWENWATDIADIAKKHIANINSILIKKNSKEAKYFDKFLEELRDDLNPEISESDAVDMMAQHIITKPVFETLFEGNKFTSDNPISKVIENVVLKIYNTKIDTENKSLEKLYQSVKRRSSGIVSSKSRTNLINELYERFFKNAFPLITKKLGIVYTPIEIVDFILSSSNYLLKLNFNKSFNDKNIQILDPFLGTGTFLTRLLSMGFIEKDKMSYKYQNEIHGNEIVLLAYYIASINIESTYHDIVRSNNYVQFNGSVLTDTFQLYEQNKDMIADLLPDNSKKRKKQKELDIKIIIGNPPYSIGQSAANENAQNIKYPNLDSQIQKFYSEGSKVTMQSGLYDSYIRAFRWATERLKDDGIISFITGSGWVDKKFAKGVRKQLLKDFSDIFIINLRGDVRKDILSNGKYKEGENVFGQGSMSGICITFLVKNSKKTNSNYINYFDIGDDLKTKEKLKKIINLNSIENIIKKNNFKKIEPDNDSNWINKGNKDFKNFYLIGSKNKFDKNKIFTDYSGGLKTSRDIWNYNFDREILLKNVEKSISFFNSEVDRFSKSKNQKLEDFINYDNSKITWDRSQKNFLSNLKKITFEKKSIMLAHYRPFTKMWVYTDSQFNNCLYQLPKIFPNNNSKNSVITVTGTGSQRGYSVFSSKYLPDIQLLQNCQNYPLYIYDNDQEEKNTLFESRNEIRFGISKFIKDVAEEKFNKKIKEKELFSYVYAILHAKEYSEKFENDLFNNMPRIPLVKSYTIFKDFLNIGEKLLEVHQEYESVKKFDLKIEINPNGKKISNKELYKFNKMQIIKNKDKSYSDKIIYNDYISLSGVPIDAYKYKINSKSPLEWVVDKQSYISDEKTGIINDPNVFANQTMSNPAYVLELLQRVITVSLDTQKLIKSLPNLYI